jgi:hypothetical protein
MSEQAVQERRGWASDIVWVLLYSILILLVIFCGYTFRLKATAVTAATR